MGAFGASGVGMGRRRFLRGSAWGALTAGLTVFGGAVAAQEPQPRDRPKTDEEPRKGADEAPRARRKLVDKNGREYRVCDMCGGNMYLEGKVWTCEQCGLTFEE